MLNLKSKVKLSLILLSSLFINGYATITNCHKPKLVIIDVKKVVRPDCHEPCPTCKYRPSPDVIDIEDLGKPETARSTVKIIKSKKFESKR